MSEESKHDIGYRKPPTKSQFQKGTSGNPQGRPKGRCNLRTRLTRILEERVIVNEDGRRRSITKLEVALKQQVNKAASGDLKALQLLIPLLRSFEDPAGDHVQRTTLPEEDRKLALNFIERYQKMKTSGGSNESND